MIYIKNKRWKTDLRSSTPVPFPEGLGRFAFIGVSIHAKPRKEARDVNLF